MLYFFFFKQKTAYEMRISDWSSDVCSSDLAATAACDVATLEALLQEEHAPELIGKAFKKLESEIVRGNILKTGKRIDGRDTKTVQIGRAPCRERVCQYV